MYRLIAILLLVLATQAKAEPIISEFMASNDAAFADGDGLYPDWIELHNPDPLEVNLGNWGLRDSVETWFFPADTILAPGAYLVVFASGRNESNYVDPAGYLHTTFRLNAAGEDLALLRPDNSVAFEHTALPPQHEDVAYGLLTDTSSLVATDSAARYLVPDAGTATNWFTAGFDDSSWTAGKATVGYKTTPGPVIDPAGERFTAYLVEAGTPGNQQYGGSLGMDFEVLSEIRVLELGVFDADSDGLFRTITAQLWSRNGNSAGSILATETFTPGDPGMLEGGNRIKPLPVPLVLPPGSYTMVAHGYGAGESNGNQGSGVIDGLSIDSGNGLLQFTGGSRFGAAGSFPTNLDAGPANRYGAGTFTFGPNGSDIETNLETEMRGINSTVFLRIPFDIADPSAIETLQLEMGFDDGFVAWLNGIEIARDNAPAVVAWNSVAPSTMNARRIYPAALVPGILQPTGNVLAVQGLNRAASDDDFIVSPRLDGIAHSTTDDRFFTRATPGGPNDPSGVVGFVGDTIFSVDRGFFDTPFSVTITTPTPGAEIRYTTDGSLPSETHGIIHTHSIPITGTTILRAAAFKADHEPTNVDTQSYLFLDEVAVRAAPPAGYPATWAGIHADYAMEQDPADFARAAGDAGFNAAEARAAIVQSLKAIPTLSIVTGQDHLYDPATGIYVNPSGRGLQWERPASVEIIGEDGTGRYQTDAGLRIMGFSSRNLGLTPKLNMRLLFKKQYGDGQLQYPLLGKEGPDSFNTIALRGNIRDAWVSEIYGFGTALYIGDEWCKRAQYDLGQPAARGMFAHVYINGMYWGLYNPTERPDDAFAETYFGGDKSEYDVVKFCCPDRSVAGTITRWDELLNASRAGLAGNAAYYQMIGSHPDGTPNPAANPLLDVDNLIDYLINGHYHASGDWPGNYYVIRDRVDGRTSGFKFFTWDNDFPLGAGNPNRGDKVTPQVGHNWWTESPGEIDIHIRANAEYRLRFADRAYKHYFNDGAMTVAQNTERWNALAARVRPALFAESARWGDAKGSALRTVQDHWDAQSALIVTNYFPGRQAIVFNQLRAHELWPDLDPPAFNLHGGYIDAGFRLGMSGGSNVYYTTDGSDPRQSGGAISPAALHGTGTVIQVTTRIRARAFDGLAWSALNEATFIVGPAPGPHLVISEFMYQPGISDTAGEYIEFMNISTNETLDLTGVQFSDGIEFRFPLGYQLGPGARTLVVADPVAFSLQHPGANVSGTLTNFLENAGERIALRDYHGNEFLGFRYDNALPWPTGAAGGGPSLVLIAPERAPDPALPENWRPSLSPGGNPGASDAQAFAGGDLEAYALASAPRLRFDASGQVLLDLHRNLAADDAVIRCESSVDLVSWSPATAVPVEELLPGNGTWLRSLAFVPPPSGSRWHVRIVISERE